MFGTVQSAKNRISIPVSRGVRFPMDKQFTRLPGKLRLKVDLLKVEVVCLIAVSKK